MSFDIFFGNFEGGVSQPFSRSIAEAAFARFVERRDADGWVLRYPDGGRADVSIEDTAEIRGFGVNRPPASPAFWEGILYVLQHTSGVVFWAGTGCVVGSAEVIPELPKDLIDAVGAPTIVTRPNEILEIIQHSD